MGNNNLKDEIAILKAKIEEQKDNINKLNEQIKAYQAKEQSISSAIIFAVERSNQLENSRRKLYELDLQRSRLLYMRLEQVLNSLYEKYPELKKDSKLKSMSEKFKNAVYSNNKNETSAEANYNKEDPIRKLLDNVVKYIDAKKEVKVIKRKTSLPSSVGDIENIYASTPSSSGFDINEALNPTENLEDILKSFNLKRDAK